MTFPSEEGDDVARPHLKLYLDMAPGIEALSDEEAGRLLKGALNYSATREIPDLSGSERVIWPMLKAQIDEDIEKHAEMCATNKRIATERNAPSRTVTNRHDAENDIINNAKKSKNTFIPPTIEEVRSYCKERNSTVDPDQFYDYFTATDWHDSKGNKVKSWKGKIVTWEKFQPKQKDEDDKPDLSWFYGDDKNA